MTPPLAGLRVLDLSRILAGPVCTQVLADLGADVVKVERPGQGDDTRQWGPPFLPDGTSAYFLSCNRGKRSLAIDLARGEARPVLDALVRRADVLVENFLPDSLTRLGLTRDRLQDLNPRLVVVSISAFGRESPGANLPGYDLMIQAGSGLMAITGEPDGSPMKVGVAISDVLTGLFGAVSALAGLVGRGGNDPGRAFDVALADCTLAALVNVAQSALITGKPPRRWGNAHPQIVPYELFASADGFITLAIGADRQWLRFCQAIGQPEWGVDPRFATNPARVEHRQVLLEQLRPVLAGRTTADWQAFLREIDVPHGPVESLERVLDGEQARARGMVLPTHDATGHPYALLGSPIHWHGEPPRGASPPPALGAHSVEVLEQWLNLSPSAIESLRSAGVIATHE